MAAPHKIEPVDPLFRVHRLNNLGMQRAEHVASCFNELLSQLHKAGLVEGREFAIVKTRLEEACFYSKKALARNPLHQQKG